MNPQAVAEITLPEFPTFDFSAVGNWFITGVSGILTSNLIWFIMPALIVAAFFGAVSFIKKGGKKVVKG